MNMKTHITIICFLLLTQIVYGKDFIEQPIHNDNHLINLSTPKIDEINTALKGKERELNIILNFLKTIDFCDGIVSRIVYEKYAQTISSLPQEIAKIVKDAVNEILERKKRVLSIIDIENTEHYLPIKFIDPEK